MTRPAAPDLSGHPPAPEVSARARRTLDGAAVGEFLIEHSRRVPHAWSPDRPDGYIGWCLAENTLTWDLLEPRMTSARDRSPTDVRYNDRLGSAALRQAMTAHAERTILRRDLAAEETLVVTAGAGTAIDAIVHAVCDPGDGVLVPTPSYNGFWADVQTRAQAVIVPVHTAADNGFHLTPALLDQAITAADRPVRALLWTNPDNPTGRVASPEDVTQIVRWADERGLHLIADEIYAGSVFGPASLTSVAEVAPSFGTRLHWVWGTSKDFGVSGLRCGGFVTGNEGVVEMARIHMMWGMASGDTQALLRDMLTDEAWVDAYLEESRRRLGEAHRVVADGLDAAGVPHVPSQAGVFMLIDLRGWLDEPTFAAEERLWRRLLEESNVNMTPGARCRIAEPGFFRLVFGAASVSASREGVRRLATALS